MAAKVKRKCKVKGCKAHPLRGGKYCYQHDPKRKKERTAARTQGGKTSMAPKTLPNVYFKLQTIPEVKAMLEVVTNTVLNGVIDINRAKAAMYAASIIITCIKEDDFEKRLKALEEHINNVKGN